MTTRSGRIVKVEYNGNTVAGQGTWTLGGFTREVIEEDSWDLDVKKKHFGVGDGGTITFSVWQTRTIRLGQNLINSCCINSSLTGVTLKFYTDATSYWRPDTGADILITKCQSITMEKSAMGTVDFEGVLTTGGMIWL